MSYFLHLVIAETIAMSLPQLTRSIDQDVRSGQLAYLLGRPCNYVFYNFAQYLGERLVRLTINGMVGAILALIFVGLPHFTWMGVMAWPLVTFFALSIDFVAYFSIGLLAFWTEETSSFALIFNRLTLVLGGVLAPITIFPEPLRSIALILPFSTILYGPSRTLVHCNVLLHVCVTASDPSAWGDIVFAIGAFVLLLHPDLLHFALFLFLSILGALIFVAFLVIFGSLAFFLGNTEGLSQQMLGALTMFSTYPMNIFNGVVRIFLFTIVPAGFISFVPLQLLQHFSWQLFGGMVGFTLLFGCVAVYIFELGLRRYESGNLLGMQN